MAELTVTNLVAAIAGAIAGSDAITSACTGLYGHGPKVHVGATGYQSASQDDYPAFTVIGWSKSRSETDTRRAYDLTVGLDLLDETVTTSGDTVTYRGADTLEALLDLAMTAIRGISNELFFDNKSMEFEPIEFFPIFSGELNLTVGFDALIGGAEPSV